MSAIHIGPAALCDSVMKSGEDRDQIAKDEGILAFEMEGAGVWEETSTIVCQGRQRLCQQPKAQALPAVCGRDGCFGDQGAFGGGHDGRQNI